MLCVIEIIFEGNLNLVVSEIALSKSFRFVVT